VEHADLGTTIRVETPDGRRDATVVQMPFVDPGKQIPKS
jgi:glycine cleavage system aminomethyltransferase T